MVLELGGFIELVNGPGSRSYPHSKKTAKQVTKGDVILFELRPLKVLNVSNTKVLAPTVTITAYDAWRNVTVKLKFPNPAESLEVVRTKVWEYLVLEVHDTILGKDGDDTELTFRVPGHQSGDTLGPFFRLVEGTRASTVLTIFEALGRYQVVGSSVGCLILS